MPILQFLKPRTPLYDILHAITLHLYQLVANLDAANTFRPLKTKQKKNNAINFLRVPNFNVLIFVEQHPLNSI